MREAMDELFSIGSVSKIFNIPIATLRYYDDIDVFKPVFTDHQTGYRYYSIDQFAQLSMIKYLRMMEVPIKEIRDFNEKINLDNYLELIMKQRENAISQMLKWSSVVKMYTKRINEIEKARNCKDLDVIRIEHLPERRILQLHERFSSRYEVELAVRKLEKLAAANIEKAGLTVSSEDLEKHSFCVYNSIFVLPEESISPEQSGLISVLREGEYACMFYRGRHSESAPYYIRLLEYIKDNGYRVCGDSIRFILVDKLLSKGQDNFLAELQIPIEKMDM